MHGGIDVGGTAIKYGIIDDKGNIISMAQMPTGASKGQEFIIERIGGVVENLNKKCISIGIGFPSVVSPIDGCVHFPPNLPGWEIVPLRDIIKEKYSVDAAIMNDANAAALAESVLGAGKDTDNFLYVTLGTGVGGGIILNRSVFTGERGGAGEIGHVIVDLHAEPSESKHIYSAGSLEEHVGRDGILNLAQRLIRKNPNSSLAHYKENLDVEHISKAAENGDVIAYECLKITGKILGLGIAGVLAVLDLHVVVIGGGISLAHHSLLDSVRDTLYIRALPTIAKSVEVHQARFTKNAGIIGAALAGKIHSEM